MKKVLRAVAVLFFFFLLLSTAIVFWLAEDVQKEKMRQSMNVVADKQAAIRVILQEQEKDMEAVIEDLASVERMFRQEYPNVADQAAGLRKEAEALKARLSEAQKGEFRDEGISSAIRSFGKKLLRFVEGNGEIFNAPQPKNSVPEKKFRGATKIAKATEKSAAFSFVVV